jgi:hypothetical protein
LLFASGCRLASTKCKKGNFCTRANAMLTSRMAHENAAASANLNNQLRL